MIQDGCTWGATDWGVTRDLVGRNGWDDTGKGHPFSQHHLNTAGHHAGCPSVLPGTLTELKRSSPITLGAKCKARNANHLLDKFPSHGISLQYEQLEVF